MSKYFDFGYDTASRGWGPYSPNWISLFSEHWNEWHRGWSAYHSDQQLKRRREAFDVLANRYQTVAEKAIPNIFMY